MLPEIMLVTVATWRHFHQILKGIITGSLRQDPALDCEIFLS
jgi:hypothetical protein